jgi:dihydrofolate reductase
MRRLILSLACSLDGYIAGADGSFDWIRMDAEDDGVATLMASVDTALIGRRTYEMARAMGQPFFRNMKNFVFSKTLEPGRQKEVEIVRDDPVEFARALKGKPGKDIWLFGGYGLTSTLLREVDEVALAIQPILLGDGLPLFPKLRQRQGLELLECRAFANGVVRLRYAMSRAAD